LSVATASFQQIRICSAKLQSIRLPSFSFSNFVAKGVRKGGLGQPLHLVWYVT